MLVTIVLNSSVTCRFKWSDEKVDVILVKLSDIIDTRYSGYEIKKKIIAVTDQWTLSQPKS